MNISNEISRLINFGVQQGMVVKEDALYSRNRILCVLGLDGFIEENMEINEELETASPVLERILDWAFENKVLESNTPVYRDLLDTEIMTCIMPRPSEVNSKYDELYLADKKSATDYFYNLSKASNYIRVDRIKKDVLWTTSTKYGKIIVTINLSKPEKDPKAIAAAKNLPNASYPKCLLCKENVGFKGNVSLPARGNHRIIPLKINDEKWYMQYSPYVYYNEHCIFFKGEHSPMAVNRKSFERLLEIVTILPHYFVGSNADLPIVGGSILTHDHFQGGCADFPMANAEIYKTVSFNGYENVQAGLVDWPMSVIRLVSNDKGQMVELADKILSNWRAYSDENVEILANTGHIPHNTITPISRYRNGMFELDLVLRNNRTNDEHPCGIFHPHNQYHHIKKENIGLIEVMGLAILPARLKEELKLIEYYLLHQEKEQELFKNEMMSIHKNWYLELKNQNITSDTVRGIVQQSIGQIFSEILENAGVFKRNEIGENAFLSFIGSCNI